MRDPGDQKFMRLALKLAQFARGQTSPNPMVGAVLVKNGAVIGRGYHKRAGLPHAEIEALRDAQRKGNKVRGSTLYVTLEPCCTQGRTPPCTEAIIGSGIKGVVVAVADPNPKHAGRGFEILKAKGIPVRSGILEKEATELNAAFNHWIVHKTPYVIIKAAMSIDGKTGTAAGISKWITSDQSRAEGMRLRHQVDGIVAGINTILLDDPSLTARKLRRSDPEPRPIRRFILDSEARTPLNSRVASDEFAHLTTIFVTESAPKKRVAALEKKVKVIPTAENKGRIDLSFLAQKLGAENVTSLLIEGGGEAVAAFLEAKLANRVAFFYAPLVIGGRNARKSVAGEGFTFPGNAPRLQNPHWKKLGPDLLLTAKVQY